MGDSDDEVLEEMEVFLAQELADHLYVLQYPLRPQWKPHEMDSIKAVRHRKAQKAVQLELKLDTSSSHYSDSSRYPLETSTLTSTLVPSLTNHCVGIVSDGKVHLTPLHAVVQMRPTLSHLDEDDNARKEEKERDSKARGKAAADAAAAEEVEDADEKGGEEEMQLMQVSFRRAESERVLERRRTSYANLTDSREKETWVELAHQSRSSIDSEELRNKLLCSSKAHIAFPCSVDEYLARLSCGKSYKGGDGMPVDLEQETPAEATLKQGLSKEAIRQMRPTERAAAILRHTHAICFSRLCELCGTTPNKQTLDEVMDVAIMVQGCWVLRSTLACSNEREVCARDMLLLHFCRERTITTKQYTELAKLTTQLAREILSHVAVAKPGYGWEFKAETDFAFEAENPSVTLAQKNEWQRIEQDLGRELKKPAASASARSDPPAAARRGGKAAGSQSAAGKSAAGR